LSNGTECDDGNADTTDYSCIAGICIGTAAPIDVDASSEASLDGGVDSGADAGPCASGFVGSSCQFGNDTTCNGHGAAQANGSCDCKAGFDGNTCNQCAPSYYDYPICVFCEPTACNIPDDDCHEPATCDSNGACAYAVKSDGTACDDHDDQTEDDSCNRGVCTGSVKLLDAGDDATKPNADPHDASSNFNPDASGQDASTTLAATESSGCACSLPRSPGGSWSSLVGALLVGLASLLRYRKRGSYIN
jgi:hypothetical protein